MNGAFMKMKFFLILLSSLCFQQANASGCFSDEYESKVGYGLELVSNFPIHGVGDVYEEFNNGVFRKGADHIDIQSFDNVLNDTHGTFKEIVNGLSAYERILNKGFKNDKNDSTCKSRLNETILSLNELKASILVADITTLNIGITNDRNVFAHGLQSISQKLTTIEKEYSEFLKKAEKLKLYKENNESVVHGSVTELVKLLNEPNYEVMVVLPGHNSISTVEKEDFSKIAGRVAKSNNPSVWKVFVLTNKNLSINQKNQLGLIGNEEVVVYDLGTGLTADRTHKAYNFSDLEGGFKIFGAFAGAL
jgi:hypothetical protein